MRRFRRSRWAAAAVVLTAAVTFLPSDRPAHAAIDSGTLGARYDATASNITFRVHSSRATRMLVAFYDTAAGSQEKANLLLAKQSGTDTWAATVSVAALRDTYGIAGTVYYGYRAWGPNWPYDPAWTKGSTAGFVADVDSTGNRFNPNKLLLDPYAREVSHDPQRPGMTDGTIYGSGPAHRAKDDGAQAPKGIVLTAPAAGGTGTKPTRALKDSIVYEVHLRGLTMNDSAIPVGERGTYKGAAAKAAALAALGVAAVEFLPVQETQNDTNDIDSASTTGDNYWGYATLNYFSPERRCSSDKGPGGPTREFRAMVKAYHDAGIKVFTDVVYNHTGEGGPWNASDKNTYSLLSFRGLDNPTYYSLTADRQSPWDNTGVGGNYNTYNPVAQNLIVDSLAYWKDTLGIDGFRHDLATVLGNTCEHGCFQYSSTDPATALRRITAEMPPRPAPPRAGPEPSISWSPTTASPRRTSTPATPRTTHSPGRTVLRTAARTTTSPGTRAAWRQTSARRPATASHS
ncbi:alpha-amylase family glycosyl hydrolase [Streptomyces formicae]|uniref:Glycosyl hydrolase family 13 catalytic domain-containing protein n=1 Tax=Streptomyces formicae TaxID=1616117 RepID=A0ABY3WT43_9ACTN|nr:alpha-amylase family glycosyl hydrolase [Streptomyces formicae]UNM13671.1 hypothetical protein J4032_21415 [Streptomyces formicae]